MCCVLEVRVSDIVYCDRSRLATSNIHNCDCCDCALSIWGLKQRLDISASFSEECQFQMMGDSVAVKPIMFGWASVGL